MKAILLSVLIVGACHVDDPSVPAPAPVAAAPLRRAAPPQPTLPPVIDLSDDVIESDADEDEAIAHAQADEDPPVIARETDPVGEDDRDSEDIPDVEDRCPDVPDADDNDGCPDPAPAAAEPDDLG